MTDWDDYRYIMTLSRLGTLRAASKSLNVSKVTVSRRLAKIEKALGQPLFHRDGATYTSNQHGSKMCLKGRAIEKIVAKSNVVKSNAVGNITIHTQHFISNFFMANRLKPLMDSNPELRVTIDESYKGIEDGAPEVSIRTHDPVDLALIRVPISHSPFGIFRCAGGALSDWVGLPKKFDYLSEVQMVEAFMGKPPIIRMGNYPGIAKAAHANGIACLLPTCIRSHFNYLHQVESSKAIQYKRTWCLYRANDASDPRVKAVVDWAVNSLGNPNKCLCGDCEIGV